MNVNCKEIIDRESYYEQFECLLCELTNITDALLADDRDTSERYDHMTDNERNMLLEIRSYIDGIFVAWD